MLDFPKMDIDLLKQKIYNKNLFHFQNSKYIFQANSLTEEYSLKIGF